MTEAIAFHIRRAEEIEDENRRYREAMRRAIDHLESIPGGMAGPVNRAYEILEQALMIGSAPTPEHYPREGE